MAVLADVQAAITAQKPVIDQLVTLLNEANDPAAMQAAVDAVNANTKTMSDAIAAHTPAAAPAPAPAG